MKIALELPVSLERDYQPEVIKNIYWVDPKINSVHYSAERDNVIHIDYDGELLPEETRTGIRDAAVKIVDSIERIQISRVFDQTSLTPFYKNDPLPHLQERGWICALFQGGYAYSGLFLRLMNGLDQVFRRYALSIQAKEHAFPGLLNYESAKRSGYLSSYPQNVNLVSHIHEDLDCLRNYLANLKNGSETADAVAQPDLICSPTICYHFWQGLADRQHNFDGLHIGTAVGSCHRYESRATSGLERLREFKMREIFAIGQPEAVAGFRDKLLQDQQTLLERFQISACIETATDPFFVDTYASKRVYQLGLNLKYETKAMLPYKDEFLAVSSVNYHENFFSKAFNISEKNDQALHSCCLGFGLDRWCLTIFAQHGLEPKKWPEALQVCLDD